MEFPYARRSQSSVAPLLRHASILREVPLMDTPGFYLTYDEDKFIGPIAPDNPAWTFTDPRLAYKCNTWATVMKVEFDIDYKVVTVD